MKLRYKLLITLGIIMLIGNYWLYSYTWTGDMLKGYFIGNIVGMIVMAIVWWLMRNK